MPSPQKFFQPLYVGHSGDFKVSARLPLLRPRSLCPLGAELHRPRTPAAPCRPQPGLRLRTCKVQEIIRVGAELA